MHIVVFGAGGIGGYFGGRLAEAGERVTFIDRGDHLQAMLTSGLIVESTKGDFTIKPVTATDDPTQVNDVDVILLCVKAWQIRAAAQDLLPMVGPNTFIIPLGNGINIPTQLAEIIGADHVLGGLSSIFSHIASPGHIQHTGAEPFIGFGELDNCPSQRCENLLEVLENSGIESDIPSDINLAMWEKFIFITALDGIGALTRVPVGLYRKKKEIMQMFQGALQESCGVAIAQGINLSSDIVERIIISLDPIPPDTIPVMQRDLMSGQPSELEQLNGAVVRMGQTLNIPTPVNSFIYYSLLPQENLARASKLHTGI
jgi:2-dehydropantoate 2-reductase